MFKSLAFFSLLAAVATATAQSTGTSDPQTPGQTTPPSQPAPIVRTYARSYPPAPLHPGRPQPQIVDSQPIPGVWLRSESQTGNQTAVKTISATPQRTEIRLDRGRLNVTVHHPADHSEILVDLPGGQVSLFKDGLYTFNADTSTIRVLHGEAAAYPGPISATAGTTANAKPSAKPIKVKEDHQLSLVAATGVKPGEIKSVEAYPYELAADLLPPSNDDRSYADYGGDYLPYPYPYYAGDWGYPYYPGFYGYGYPFAYGIGFGYYGGFGGGYYRGGFRR